MGHYNEYGEWVEDDEDLWGTTNNMFLQPQVMGDFSKYGVPEATDAATLGRELGLVDKIMDNIYDPRVSHFNDVMNNAGTFPWESLAQGGGGVGDPLQMGGGMGMGGGGYGGGGGGGYGGGMSNDAVWGNMFLQSAGLSDDPVQQTIYEDIVTKQLDPTSVKRKLLTTGITDQNELDLYNDFADKLFTANVNVQQGQMQQMGGPQSVPATQLGQIVGKWGTVNPLQGYTADNLPADLMPDSNRFLTQTLGSADEYDRKAKAAQAKAVYSPYTAPAATLPTSANGIPIVRRAGTTPDATDRLRQTQLAALEASENPNPVALKQLRNLVGGGGGGEITASVGPGFEADARRVLNARAPSGTRGGGPLSLQAIAAQGKEPAIEGNRYLVKDWMPGGSGQRYTNREGMMAEHFKRQATTNRRNAVAGEQWLRNKIAQDTNAMGRSPQRDALQRQVALLRQFGVGI